MNTVTMTTNPVEVSVMDLLKLQTQCKSLLSEDTIRRIQAVRSICKNAESSEGGGAGISWRRGVPNSFSKPQSSKPSGPPSKWRGGGGGGGKSHHSEKPYTKYVSKFTNSASSSTSSGVENKILNHVILNKLNKFSAANYNEVKEFLEQILSSDEKDFLHDFMLLVFKKASSEPTFCGLYARMISELAEKYPFLHEELDQLYGKFMDIFEEVSEESCSDYEQFVQRNREKQHRLGYSQFLGELTTREILQINHLKNLYTKLIDLLKIHGMEGEGKQNLVEEYVDCLVKMTCAFQKDTSEKLKNSRNELKDMFEKEFEEILSNRSTKYPGLSRKASFTIMDCLDILRGNQK
jgi:hypothetical protein